MLDMETREKILAFVKKPSRLYVILALLAGITISIILPPFRGPDEAAHVFRVYEITSGDLFLDKGTSSESGHQGNGHLVPESLSRVNHVGFKNEEKNLSKQIDNFYQAGERRSSDTDKFEIFEGAGIYSPLSYLNYLVPSVVAQAFHTNSYIYTLFLRIGGLISSIAFIYLAIRITPIGKWFFVAIGLLPMALHQLSVVSTDGLLIASSLLFVAVILHLRFAYNELSKKPTTIALFSLAILVLASIVASKPGYWPVLLITLLLVKKPRALLRLPAIIYTASVGVAVVLYVIWYGLISLQQQTDLKHFFEQANPQSTLITKGEFFHQVRNPITVMNKFYSTYVSHPLFKKVDGDIAPNYQPSFIFNTFIGSFASLNIYPPSWLSLTVIGSLLVAFLAGYKEKRLYKNLFGRKEKVIPLIGLIGSFVAVSVIFWMSWTTSDMPFIFGVQGRYFIPLLALFVFFIPSKKIINLRDNIVLRALVVLFLINSYMMLTSIYNYFYA